MSIKIFRLINGEELISDFKEEDSKIILENPAKLVMFPAESGGMGMALMPWVPYSDQEKFEIKQDHVLIYLEAPDELEKEYREKFGSGLYTGPGSSDIIM